MGAESSLETKPMKLEEFLECTVDELLAAKRNSFSRSIIEQNSGIEDHQELLKLRKEGVNGELTMLLFICKNLTIHAIDEKQSPIPFSFLDGVYGNSVFILQYLPRKKVYALTLFRNTDNGNDFGSFFAKTYYSGSNALKADRNSEAFKTFLDFGLMKCAMTMDKRYGIQDLLEVAWEKLLKSVKYDDVVSDKSGKIDFYSVKTARFMFNVEHPNLSTVTLYGDNDLYLAGKTKLIDDDRTTKQISEAIHTLSKRYNIYTKG